MSCLFFDEEEVFGGREEGKVVEGRLGGCWCC